MKVYIAHWFDSQDKMHRVAGVYANRRSADQRIDQLGSGSVQALTIGKPVLFTHEIVDREEPRQMSDEEFVEQKHPFAWCHKWGGWRDGETGYVIHEEINQPSRIGAGETEAEAWADASTKLREKPSKPTHTMTVEYLAGEPPQVNTFSETFEEPSKLEGRAEPRQWRDYIYALEKSYNPTVVAVAKEVYEMFIPRKLAVQEFLPVTPQPQEGGTDICPCGGNMVETIESQQFQYGVGNHVTLTAFVPVFTCNECGDAVTDWRGEQIRAKVVEAHLGGMATKGSTAP